MAASILGSLLVGLLVLSTIRVRRRESRRDSIARFADARKAMSVTQARPAVRAPSVTPQPSEPGLDSASVVVRSGSATLLDPIARRRVAEVRKRFRSDPELLARRPTVAMLPTLVTPNGDAHPGGLHAAKGTPPLPTSEAS
jgi:hypothetical protein